MEREIKNAKITSVWLGVEDHGLLTAYVNLTYDASGQSFGGWNFGAASKGITSPFGVEFIRRVLETVGVKSWGELPGQVIRVDADFGKVYRIGNALKDVWFDPSTIAGA